MIVVNDDVVGVPAAVDVDLRAVREQKEELLPWLQRDVSGFGVGHGMDPSRR